MSPCNSSSSKREKNLPIWKYTRRDELKCDTLLALTHSHIVEWIVLEVLAEKTIYDVRKFLAAKSFATRKVEISIQRMVTEEKKSFSNNLFRAAKACVCLTLNCIFEFRFCLISTFLAGWTVVFTIFSANGKTIHL